MARGLATRSQLSHSDPKRFALTTRTEKASAILGHVTSINVSVPAPLASILNQFKYPTGTEILIDRPALAAAAISESTAVTCRAEKLSQGEALGKLLDPLELTWRAVDAGTLQVTTPKAAAARMELEFYPVGKLLAAQPQAALIERIKTSLSGAKWGRARRWRRDPFRPDFAMPDHLAIPAHAASDRRNADGKGEVMRGEG